MSTYPYEEFNVDQLVPILNDIKLAKTIIANISSTISEYIESICEISSELKESGLVSDEIKAKIDKNVAATLNELNSIINQQVSFRNVGSKKEKLFERLQRGMTYKYKINNGTIVDNPKPLQFIGVKLDNIHRTLEIGTITFQLSDSSDYIPLISDMSNFLLTINNQVSSEEVVTTVLNKLQAEILKSKSMQANLEVSSVGIAYSLDILVEDIRHFKLFDPEILNQLQLY